LATSNQQFQQVESRATIANSDKKLVSSFFYYFPTDFQIVPVEDL